MFKIISNFGVGLLCAGLGLSQAMANDVTNDQLSQLIQRVEHSKASVTIDTAKSSAKATDVTLAQLEKNVLGRASWKIQCRVNVFEDSKVCIMKKGDIIVMRLNNEYSVSIGESHQNNAMVEARVDKQSTLQAREGLYRDASRLIDQMKRGSYIFTRYKKSSEKDYIESKTSLVGFTSAFQDLQLQFNQFPTTSKL